MADPGRAKVFQGASFENICPNWFREVKAHCRSCLRLLPFFNGILPVRVSYKGWRFAGINDNPSTSQHVDNAGCFAFGLFAGFFNGLDEFAFFHMPLFVT
jgi:hypothetical protein